MNHYEIVRKKSTPSLFQSLEYTVVTLNEVKHKELTEKVSSPEPYTSGVEIPTEDCKDVIFNVMKYKELFSEGHYSFHEEKNEISLKQLYRSGTESNGFGTAVIRKLVCISLMIGKPLTTEASYSSHFFYLKMGMIPSQREILYCTVAYGAFALDAIRKLCECTDIKQIKNLSQNTKSDVSKILKREKSWSEKEITDEDLFENLGLFSELTNKKVSYITESFIPDVLGLLGQLKGGEKPSTTWWGSLMMVMSPEGLQRWEKAIKNGFEFRLFRDYSHLRPYMTKAQHEKLDKILATEKASSQKPSSCYMSS